MTEKCNSLPKYRSFEGLAPLTREVQDIARPIFGKRGFVSVDILAHWSDMIGADLAQGITPEKLVFDRDTRTNGTLYVRSAGGAFAMLFEHQKARVLERVNGFFGYPAVSQIKIRQGALKLKPVQTINARNLTSAEEEKLQNSIADITDPALRERAYNLGKAILIKQPTEE